MAQERNVDYDYVERIANARVYDVATETPLELASALSAKLGNRIWLKREDLQPVFSFKLRGAYNKLAMLPDEVVARGVICSSAGNHAQGVALAARRRGIPAVVVMPVTTPSIKVNAVRALGGEVVLEGDNTTPPMPARKKSKPNAAWFSSIRSTIRMSSPDREPSAPKYCGRQSTAST